MYKLSTLFFAMFLLLGTNLKAQKVIVTNRLNTVPEGKKWVLETGKSTLIQIQPGTLQMNNLCNALFFSNPRVISTVFEVESKNYFGQRKAAYSILTDDVSKVPYTNDFTYKIVPITIVDENFDLNELRTKKMEDVGMKKITFLSGQSIHVASCLQSIEFTEMPLNNEDLVLLEKEKVERKKQKEQYEEQKKQSAIQDSISSDFTMDKYPQFQGGGGALWKYIGANLKYPPKASRANTSGKVIIKVLIDTDGQVKNPEVIKGLENGCTEEALRIINLMPKWTPALSKSGKPMKCTMQIPVSFQLE